MVHAREQTRRPTSHDTTTEGRPNTERGDTFYNRFYRDGGWKYSLWREYLWHRKHVVKRFALRRGMRMLEAACGNGFHTNLFRKMGFDCTGVDRSPIGIAWARLHHPKATYHCADIMADMPVPRHSFDVVLARGCSNYHYDLHTEQALATTRQMLSYLKPGGVFVMVILTDLSGRKEPGKVWHNRLSDYEEHFRSFGLRYSIDWAKGGVICGIYSQADTQLLGEAAIPRAGLEFAGKQTTTAPEQIVRQS